MENENKPIDVSSPLAKDMPPKDAILTLLFSAAILYGGYLGWDWLFPSVPDIEMDPMLSQFVSVEDCEIVNGYIVSCVIGSKAGVTIRANAMSAVGFDADGVRLDAGFFPTYSIGEEQKSRERVGHMEGGKTEVIKITWR